MPKKLYRDLDDKWLAGVLSGAATYLNVDVVVLRLLFIFLLFATAVMPGVLGYVIAWIIIPPKPSIEPVDKADYTVYS